MNKKKSMVIWLYVGIFVISSWIFFSAQSAQAENIVQSTIESRLMLGFRVGQEELKKLLPVAWLVNPAPSGPMKDANLFVVLVDPLLFQDAQGKPDVGAFNRYVVFSVPAKNTQTGETASVVIAAGVASATSNVPGPYKTNVMGTVKREQTHKGANTEIGIIDDAWEIRDTQGGLMELRIQYERALPVRTKQEQKVYSSVEPTFYRIYRSEITIDLVKSIPMGVDRVKNYRFNVAMPKVKNLFDGSEQLVGVVAYPVFLRQIFLP